MVGAPTRGRTTAMSSFVDDLARSLAQPIPRRRALSLLGQALLAAALPSVLRPRPARANSCTECNTNPNTPILCVQPVAEGICYHDCCSPTALCCKTAHGALCCEPTSCFECGSAPDGDGIERPICVPKTGTVYCTDYEAHRLFCCNTGEICCGAACCGTNEDCCTDATFNYCCETTGTCCHGKCCKAGEECCGTFCCGLGETCCGDHCCAYEWECCTDYATGEHTCCPPTQKCSGGHCKCKGKKKKCGKGKKARKCCKNETCCGLNDCCAPDQVCCTDVALGGFCCPPGWVCSTDALGNAECLDLSTAG